VNSKHNNLLLVNGIKRPSSTIKRPVESHNISTNMNTSFANGRGGSKLKKTTPKKGNNKVK
jgi:hypothetical protein